MNWPVSLKKAWTRVRSVLALLGEVEHLGAARWRDVQGAQI